MSFWKSIKHVGTGATFLSLLMVGIPGVFAQIGKQAQERALESAGQKLPISPSDLDSVLSWVPILITLLLLLVVVLAAIAMRLVDFDPFKRVKATPINAVLWVVFGASFFVYVGYEFLVNGPKMLPPASSKHGETIDFLFNITAFFTVTVFLVTHLVLFWFAYAYHYSSKRTAIFYPDNHKLEIVWTLIPAVALAFMVLPGLKFWNDVHYPDYEGKKPINIEVVGEQFQWRLRYAGNDGKLGKHKFKLINDTNPTGLDSTDAAVLDDKILTEKVMHFPVNHPIKFSIRSKDVLHGVFLPHFRVNMYAVPGMPTQFEFQPTKTTAEMRKKLNKPEFNYEMLCSQLCGAAHYNMRVQIIVESEAEYQKWLASQPTVGPQDQEMQKNLTIVQPINR